MYVGGSPALVHLLAANYSSAVAVTLEYSDDGVTWWDTDIAVSDLDNNDQSFWTAPVEYLRFVVGTNANTTDVALHAVVTSG